VAPSSARRCTRVTRAPDRYRSRGFGGGIFPSITALRPAKFVRFRNQGEAHRSRTRLGPITRRVFCAGRQVFALTGYHRTSSFALHGYLAGSLDEQTNDASANARDNVRHFFSRRGDGGNHTSEISSKMGLHGKQIAAALTAARLTCSSRDVAAEFAISIKSPRFAGHPGLARLTAIASMIKRSRRNNRHFVKGSA